MLFVCIGFVCRYHSTDAAKVDQILRVFEIDSEFESKRKISVYYLFARKCSQPGGTCDTTGDTHVYPFFLACLLIVIF